MEIFQWVFCFLCHQGTDLLCVELLPWRSSAAGEALREKGWERGALLRCWREGQTGEGTGKRGVGGQSAGEVPDLHFSSEWRTSGPLLHAPWALYVSSSLQEIALSRKPLFLSL